jgi:hypothetical protein
VCVSTPVSGSYSLEVRGSEMASCAEVVGLLAPLLATDLDTPAPYCAGAQDGEQATISHHGRWVPVSE